MKQSAVAGGMGPIHNRAATNTPQSPAQHPHEQPTDGPPAPTTQLLAASPAAGLPLRGMAPRAAPPGPPVPPPPSLAPLRWQHPLQGLTAGSAGGPGMPPCPRPAAPPRRQPPPQQPAPGLPHHCHLLPMLPQLPPVQAPPPPTPPPAAPLRARLPAPLLPPPLPPGWQATDQQRHAGLAARKPLQGWEGSRPSHRPASASRDQDAWQLKEAGGLRRPPR